jgi:hypothetical protein
MRRNFHAVVSPVSRTLLTALLFGIAVSLSAQEIDFSLSNTTGLGNAPGEAQTARYDHENQLMSSLRWDLGRWLRLSASGFVVVESDFRGSTDAGGDLTSLQLRGQIPRTGRDATGREYARSSVFGFALGRQELTEFSGFVMDTAVDGLSLSYTTPVVDLGVTAGYHGLRLRNASALLSSPSETADQENLFAPSRGIGKISVALPEVISRQSVLFTGIGQIDLPELPTAGAEAASSTERYHALHVGTGVTGPVTTQLFYTVFGYYYAPWFRSDSGDADYSGTGFAGGGSVRYYVEEFAYSSLQLRGAYASGDGGRSQRIGGGAGGTTHFVPITDPQVTALLDVAFTNVVLGEASYSFRPFAPSYPRNTGVRVELQMQALGRPTAGAGSVDGLESDAPAGYLGTAAKAEIRYRPTSDLILSLVGAAVWPGEAAVAGGLLPDGAALLRAGIDARLEF